MRKLFLLYLILIGAFCVPASAEFTLPASLTVIEGEAFLGTAADVVVIQEGLETIGDQTFAKMPSLRRVEIPQSVAFIADDAFEGSENAVFYGVTGSYAECWAKSHGIVFIDVAALVNDDHFGKLPIFLGAMLCGMVLVIPEFDSKRYATVTGVIRVHRRMSQLYPVLYDFP